MPGTKTDPDNRIQSDYDQEFSNIVARHEIADDLKRLEESNNSAAGNNKDGNTEKVNSAEEAGNTHSPRLKPEHRGWENRVTPHEVLDKNKLGKAMVFAKKHKGFLGLVSVFGISGALLATFFGPASMMINMVQNLSIHNDTTSRSLERRFLKNFQHLSEGDPICANSNKLTIRCSTGVMSEHALHSLKKKGITAIIDGSPYENPKLTGYPKGKITAYSIDLGDGSPRREIPIEGIEDFLAKSENSKYANKILGRGGAISLRFKSWTGKHIYSKLYSRFKISPDGGLAARAKNLKGTVLEKIRLYAEKVPGAAKAAEVYNETRSSILGRLEGVKKAGAAYTASVAGCIAVRIPSLLAGGIAAVQLAQILTPTMDIALSSGSMAQAAGVTNTLSPEGMEVAATAVTEQTRRESDGKLTSAMDSVYLLAAMGVNKGKPAPSKKFTPGFAALTNPGVKLSNDAAKAASPACKVIMGKTAMYTAMAADIALTVAASATIIGGIIKIAGSWMVSEIAVAAATKAFEAIGPDVFKAFAENKDIPNARGEALGDVLGIGATAFFAAGGMARNLPVLSKAQLADASEQQTIAETARKNMDIASLSPFDTSSPYTFLGSIVHNVNFAMLANNSYNNNLFSVASNIARLPQIALGITTPKANAADITSSCDYAEYFNLNTEDDATTPAINMAGLPCTGYTGEQITMSPKDAINLMVHEGWLKDDVPVSMSDSILDLVEDGVIVPDTPLSDTIEQCGDASTGSYFYDATNCVAAKTIGTGEFTNPCEGTGKDRTCAEITDPANKPLEIPDDPRSMLAINVFLGDYQVKKIINGEDVGYGDASGNNNGGPSLVDPTEWSVPLDHKGQIDKTSSNWLRWVNDLGGNGNTSTGVLKPINTTNPNYCSPNANTLNQDGGGNFFNPNAAASAEALTKAFNEANPGRYFVGGACFRSFEAQKRAYGDGSSGFAARPGTSNHGWGLAIDTRIATTADGIGTSIGSFTSKDYLWLIANSPRFGWVNPVAMRPEGGCFPRGQKQSGKSPCEPWHFQYVGPLYAN